MENSKAVAQKQKATTKKLLSLAQQHSEIIAMQINRRSFPDEFSALKLNYNSPSIDSILNCLKEFVIQCEKMLLCNKKKESTEFKIEEAEFTYRIPYIEKCKMGDTLECVVTYVKDWEKQLFYVNQCDSPKCRNFLQRLAQSDAKSLSMLNNVPSEGELFGVLLNGFLFRGVRQNGDFLTYNFKVILVDIGEVVTISHDTVTYELSPGLKNFPPQGIACKLLPYGNIPNLSSMLCTTLYRKLNFTILGATDSLLFVYLSPICSPQHTKLNPEKSNSKDTKAEVLEKVNYFDKFMYPPPDYSNLRPRCIINAVITGIKDMEGHLFYINISNNNEYIPYLEHLGRYCLELRMDCGRLPNETEVFALLLEGFIFRCVRETGPISSFNFKVYLIDVGEVVTISKDTPMYIIPYEYQKIPSQAILCKLLSVDDGCSVEDMWAFLARNACKKQTFTVKAFNGSILYVYIDKRQMATPPGENINPFKIYYARNFQIKVRNNYNSHRIGRRPPGFNNEPGWYNIPSYAPRFVGLDAYRDPDEYYYSIPYGSVQLPSNYFEENFMTNEDNDDVPYLLKPGIKGIMIITNVVRVLDIYPTHVVNAEYFYAQLAEYKLFEETLKDLHYKMNTPEAIASYRLFNRVPVPSELLICQYKDGMWYRAKMLHTIDDVYIKVLYLDYGNTEIVTPDRVRRWVPRFGELAFQAILCRLMRVKQKRNRAVESTIHLRKRILYKKMTAEIVGFNRFFFVNIKDSNNIDIGEELIRMNLVGTMKIDISAGVD